MTKDEKYREPEATIADVEILVSVSYRTARRIMDKIRKAYGIPKYHRPTIEQVKAYLIKIA